MIRLVETFIEVASLMALIIVAIAVTWISWQVGGLEGFIGFAVAWGWLIGQFVYWSEV